MSCKLQDSQPDWKSYAFEEMDPAARRVADAHLASCGDCQDELAGLRATLSAMGMLRDEEIPRRIAFVSDQVFEPRWWQKMFVRPSFAAAAVLAGAILVHAFVRPPVSAAPAVDAAAIEKRITAQITTQVTGAITQRVRADMDSTLQSTLESTVQSAVSKAVAQTRQQDDVRTTALLAAAERRYAETAEMLSKQVTRIYAMNSGAGVR
jgi:hypothetical protein